MAAFGLPFLFIGIRHKFKHIAVNAITLVRGWWTIVKHMAQVNT
jgi:hypothetical protein